MFYGIPLGLSMLVGSLLGKFWIGVGVGLTLNLITFLWIRLPLIKTTLKKLGFPKIGGTPLKSTATWFWNKKMWVIYPALVLAILLVVLNYHDRLYITRGEEDWIPVSMATKCTPTWNEKQGWCDIGTFPAGTYRIVPQFETWQMGLAPSKPPKATDQESYPMSAEGLDVKVYLADNEKISDFFKTAFVKSYRYGGLIMKVGTSLPIEVIGNDGLPRELVLQKESKISINVNLPKLPERFSTNQGALTVEVQRLSP